MFKTYARKIIPRFLLSLLTSIDGSVQGYLAERNDSRRLREELFQVLLSLLTLLTAVYRGIWRAGKLQDVRKKNYSTGFIVFIDQY